MSVSPPQSCWEASRLQCNPGPLALQSLLRVTAFRLIDISRWSFSGHSSFCRLASAQKTSALELETMGIPAPASLPRRGRWTPSHSSMRTRKMPSLSLKKQRIWMRTSSRRGSPARLLLRDCQSLREEPLSQIVPPLVELKIDQSQRTELYPTSRTAAGAKLCQQGVIPTGCSATSVAHCLGGPSATLNAPTLTRLIPNRPTTVSRARLVSGRLLFEKS